MPNDAAGLARNQPDVPAARNSVGIDGLGWRFARRPFWLFSHLLAAVVVVAFVNFGFWQLRRLDERQSVNAEIEVALNTPTVDLSSASGIDALPEFQPVSAAGEYVETDLARVVNRSHRSQAGEHVVGILRLDDGSLLTINRGFVPIGVDELSPPTADAGNGVELVGWVRPSVEREQFGVEDTETAKQMPRLDTEMVASRLGAGLPSKWFQVAPADDASAPSRPEPVPLPALDDGPHLSYAMQWFTFALLTLVFYGALLRRRARPEEL